MLEKLRKNCYCILFYSCNQREMFVGIVCQPLITFPLPKAVTAVAVPHLSLDKVTLGAGRFSAVHQMCWHSPSPKAMILCTAERTAPAPTLTATSLTLRVSTAILLTLFFVLFNFVLVKKKRAVVEFIFIFVFKYSDVLYLNWDLWHFWNDFSAWTSPMWSMVMVWKCLVGWLVGF